MDRKWQLISTRARLEDRGWKPHATGPRLHCSNERAHPSVGGGAQGWAAGLSPTPSNPGACPYKLLGLGVWGGQNGCFLWTGWLPKGTGCMEHAHTS